MNITTTYVGILVKRCIQVTRLHDVNLWVGDSACFGITCHLSGKTVDSLIIIRDGYLLIKELLLSTYRELNNQVFYVGEFGLVNENGEMQSRGIASVYPSNYTAAGYLSGTVMDLSKLQPGQVTVTTTKEIIYLENARDILPLEIGRLRSVTLVTELVIFSNVDGWVAKFVK